MPMNDERIAQSKRRAQRCHMEDEARSAKNDLCDGGAVQSRRGGQNYGGMVVSLVGPYGTEEYGTNGSGCRRPLPIATTSSSGICGDQTAYPLSRRGGGE